jgi:hypothetical protein
VLNLKQCQKWITFTELKQQYRDLMPYISAPNERFQGSHNWQLTELEIMLGLQRPVVFVVVNIYIVVFRIMIPHNPVHGYQYFRRTCCSHLQGKRKMETAGFSEILIITYEITQCHNPEEQNITGKSNALGTVKPALSSIS